MDHEVDKDLPPKEAAIEKLNTIFQRAHETSQAVLFMTSGGSSLELLDGIHSSNFGPSTTVTVLDERYSTDPTVNNMAQLMETKFYKRIEPTGAHFIDTRIKDGETQAQLAERFNNEILSWRHKNPTGMIIATTGIGPDGHISGMMPFPEDPEKFKELFDDQDGTHLVVAYDAGDKNPHSKRVTTTMNLMNKIHTAVAYVVGESKRDTLKRFENEDGSLAELPSRILHTMPGKAYLFTDITL